MMSKREIVGLLIAKGADVNAKVAPSDRFFKGKTPLDLASKAEIDDLLRKHGGKTGEELKAEGQAQQSTPPPEAKTIEPAAEVAQSQQDAKLSNAETDKALLDAARDGNIEAVKQHLAAGANVNAKNFRRNVSEDTPLHEAARKGHKEIAELLLAKGADVNAKNAYGETVLLGVSGEVVPSYFSGSDDGRNEIVELLIANGANVNAAKDT